MKSLFIPCVLFLVAQNVHADGLYLNGQYGTLGTGYEIKHPFGASFSGRMGFNSLSYGQRLNSSQMNYDTTVDFRSFSLIADWHPGDSAFRISAGLLYNGSEVDLDARPVGGAYRINGVSYNSTDVGSMRGSLGYRSTAPYLGIGWGYTGSKKRGWGFAADLGVLYQGSPKVSLTSVCGAGLSSSQCSALQFNTEAESAQLQRDLEDSTWYPVFSLGARLRF